MSLPPDTAKRRRVLELRQRGYLHREIAETLEMNLSTVWYYCTGWVETRTKRITPVRSPSVSEPKEPKERKERAEQAPTVVNAPLIELQEVPPFIERCVQRIKPAAVYVDGIRMVPVRTEYAVVGRCEACHKHIVRPGLCYPCATGRPRTLMPMLVAS